MADSPRRQTLWIALIAASVGIWGAVLALGATLVNHDRRSYVVLGCVGAFLAFWFVLLMVRQARLNRRRKD